MAHSSTGRGTAGALPRGARLLAAAVALEAALLAGYFLATPATVTVPRYVVYPFVWINAAVVAVARTDPPRAPFRRSAVAAVVAAAYFLLVANWAGLVGLTGAGHHAVEGLLGLHVGAGSPGWERVRLVTRTVYVSFVPFRVIGYFGLAYLVYVTVLDATTAVVSGALGLFSCLSCSFPILASLVAAVWGGSLALGSTVSAYSLDLSTLAFLASVALLYWRPGFPSFAGDDGDDG